MMRPILELASEGDISRRSMERAMGAHFGLSPEEMALKIPSGQFGLVLGRAGWAMTYLTKAGLISKIAPKTYRATEQGSQFLKQHSGDITAKDLLVFESFRTFHKAERPSSDNAGQIDAKPDARTPAETIDGAVLSVHADLRGRILEAILAKDYVFFEHLVLEVLVAMGYGGPHEKSFHTGKSGDEGIDGRINQDALGLDQVLVQAKRFNSKQVVSRKEIQAFIGSLTGQGVTKGVFITTSSFAASAEEFVQRGSPIKVVLIDGEQLVDLMMRYRVGVRTERTIDLLEVDQNYFGEE
jgi:restriction system protein